jgi:predicted GIY-YIG superfamily endonuclease
MADEWYFYMVRCRDNSLYSGITDNPEERVKKHNSGAGAKYTFSHRPVNLVYTEKHTNQSEARKREIQVKSWSKEKKEQLVAGLPRVKSRGFPRLRSE